LKSIVEIDKNNCQGSFLPPKTKLHHWIQKRKTTDVFNVLKDETPNKTDDRVFGQLFSEALDAKQKL